MVGQPPLVTTAAERARQIRDQFLDVRQFSQELCEPLEPEDCVIQSMPDVSPTRWHLAHTTWFFETFVLSEAEPDFQPFDARFEYLFNSYYNTVGRQFPRSQRGLLSRPTLREIFTYRDHVDQHLVQWLRHAQRIDDRLLDVIELGLHHEQQHQELMLTDIKHVFSCNPLFPVYRRAAVEMADRQEGGKPDGDWVTFDAGLYQCGLPGDDEGFGYDNEFPAHQVYVNDFALADRLVTCGEYLEFIQDGGYQRPELWLSLGWSWLEENGHSCPLYWFEQDGCWHLFTLAGLRPVEPNEPVCHLSYFEADAFARWASARLPTEFEWEVAAREAWVEPDSFVESRIYHPLPAGLALPTGSSDSAAGGGGERPGNSLRQMFGSLWQWTASPYTAYPGYKPADGALGEYNGKFMCNQFVLRGGSCATSRSHIRPTYRNFFPPDARWQFSGLRLARDAG